MTKHKKGAHEEHMSEAWLLPYSDLMTLLLAVFIVLFAVSQTDAARLDEIAQSFRGLFTGQPSVIIGTQGASGPGTGTSGETSGEASGNQILNVWDAFPQPPYSLDEQDAVDYERYEQVEAFAEALRTYFAQNRMEPGIEESERPYEIILSLGSDVMFPSGSAQLNASQTEIAKTVAAVIYEAQRDGLRFRVQVSGHTDNVPIHTAQYTSNWNLSLDRAAQFMAAMINGTNLDPRVFTAVGHGELDPIDTNDTAEGRARNRRVEVSFMLAGATARIVGDQLP